MSDTNVGVEDCFKTDAQRAAEQREFEIKQAHLQRIREINQAIEEIVPEPENEDTPTVSCTASGSGSGGSGPGSQPPAGANEADWMADNWPWVELQDTPPGPLYEHSLFQVTRDRNIVSIIHLRKVNHPKTSPGLIQPTVLLALVLGSFLIGSKVKKAETKRRGY